MSINAILIFGLVIGLIFVASILFGHSDYGEGSAPTQNWNSENGGAWERNQQQIRKDNERQTKYRSVGGGRSDTRMG